MPIPLLSPTRIQGFLDLHAHPGSDCGSSGLAEGAIAVSTVTGKVELKSAKYDNDPMHGNLRLVANISPKCDPERRGQVQGRGRHGDDQPERERWGLHVHVPRSHRRDLRGRPVHRDLLQKTTVTLTPNATKGQFSKWTDACAGDPAACMVTLDPAAANPDKGTTAKFK